MFLKVYFSVHASTCMWRCVSPHGIWRQNSHCRICKQAPLLDEPSHQQSSEILKSFAFLNAFQWLFKVFPLWKYLSFIYPFFMVWSSSSLIIIICLCSLTCEGLFAWMQELVHEKLWIFSLQDYTVLEVHPGLADVRYYLLSWPL